MRSKQNAGQSKQVIHVEFADFSSEEFFSVYDKYVIRLADSLGMNEQELQMVLDLWDNKLNLREAQNSKPNFEVILK